eukprot:GFUD01038471.1.p1 GENE.GFUD01038471.1~~GFUD01038471.1.p1  ORF type:complete len:466 (-),score=137.85 GFUD01038471.1:60-1457(-)
MALVVMAERESVIVVGTRPTLPHHQVEMEDTENSLRFRSSNGSSPELFYAMNTNVGPTASSPVPGQGTDGERRSAPRFGTPGSLADLCPDQLYLAPLDIKETPSPNLKLKMDQTFEKDSGYAARVLGSESGSRNSSVFDPFPNPEGSYVSNSSIWEKFSPVEDLKRKWKGRPSYLENSKMGSMMDKFSVEPQQLLGCLMLMVISASVGFAFLITFKHMERDSVDGRNSKYQSIEFGSQKLVGRLRKEGRMIGEVRDEEGNLLGGKKAAIQFIYDQGRSMDAGEEDAKVAKAQVEVNDKVGEEDIKAAAFKEFEVKLDELLFKDTSGLAGRILEAAGGLKTNDAEVRSLEDEIEELEKQKQQMLERIRRVKMFDKGSRGTAPQPRRFGVEEEMDIEVDNKPVDVEEQKLKPKKSKSPANPLVKSLPKPKMSKANVGVKSSVVIRQIDEAADKVEEDSAKAPVAAER